MAQWMRLELGGAMAYYTVHDIVAGLEDHYGIRLAHPEAIDHSDLMAIYHLLRLQSWMIGDLDEKLDEIIGAVEDVRLVAKKLTT